MNRIQLEDSSMSNHKDSDNGVKDPSRRNFFKKSTASAGAPIRQLAQKPGEKRVLGKKSVMSRRTFVKAAAGAAAVVGLAWAVPLPQLKLGSDSNAQLKYRGKITPEDRRLAAIRANAMRASALASGSFVNAALIQLC
jgi:hypothetical protein